MFFPLLMSREKKVWQTSKTETDRKNHVMLGAYITESHHYEFYECQSFFISPAHTEYGDGAIVLPSARRRRRVRRVRRRRVRRVRRKHLCSL